MEEISVYCNTMSDCESRVLATEKAYSPGYDSWASYPYSGAVHEICTHNS